MTKQNFRALFNNLLEDIYPNGLICLDCKDELIKEEDRYFSLCAKCREKLPTKKGLCCVHCASGIAKGTVCKDCYIILPYYDKILVDFYYGGIIRNMIINYKDFKKTFLYEYIAKFIINTYNRAPEAADYITFVPSDPASIKLRGFEANAKVANMVAENIGIPSKRFLTRLKKTSDQTKLTKVERLQNIKNDFELDTTEDLEEKIILLIDDVVTTGHTVNECARILKYNGGVQKVIVLTLARA